MHLQRNNMVLATFKDTLNELLKSGAFYIALGLTAIIVVTVILLLVLNRKK